MTSRGLEPKALRIPSVKPGARARFARAKPGLEHTSSLPFEPLHTFVFTHSPTPAVSHKSGFLWVDP